MKTYIVFFDYKSWEGGVFGGCKKDNKGSLLYSCEQFDDQVIADVYAKIQEHYTSFYITSITEVIV